MKFRLIATAIKKSSARPSSLTRAKSAACPGQRRIASAREASFDDATESCRRRKPPRGTFARPRRYMFDEGLCRAPPINNFGEQPTIDGRTVFWAIPQGRHVGDFEKIAAWREKRERARRTNVDPDCEFALTRRDCLLRSAVLWATFRIVLALSQRTFPEPRRLPARGVRCC